MSDERFPDSITVDGARFRILAVKQGRDRDGRAMRYRMEYEGGGLVLVDRVQMRRGSIGLIFTTPFGDATFDFKLEGKD